jgi:hypothetical protein
VRSARKGFVRHSAQARSSRSVSSDPSSKGTRAPRWDWSGGRGRSCGSARGGGGVASCVAREPAALAVSEGPVRLRGRGPVWREGAPPAEAVALGDLAREQGPAREVGDGVVHRPAEHPLGRRGPPETDALQGATLEVERAAELGRELLVARCRPRLLERRREVGVNPQHELAVAFLEGRAQRLVALDRVLERAAQGRDVEGAVDAEQRADVVGARPGMQLLQEPELALDARCGGGRGLAHRALRDWATQARSPSPTAAGAGHDRSPAACEPEAPARSPRETTRRRGRSTAR